MYGVRGLVIAVLGLSGAADGRAQQWIQPTPDELAMTSIPQVPGAPAVILNHEETTEDSLHMFSFYSRIKILSEQGKERANVELPYSKTAGATIDSVAGRTIEPDGTVVPFTGRPYEKMVRKGQGLEVREKIFTLPDVRVGSIIEYRYKLHYDDNWFINPDWYIQSDLYMVKAHYLWKPTGEDLITEEGNSVSNSIAYTPVLPEGVKVLQQGVLGSQGRGSSGYKLELNISDVPPIPHEDFMPPLDSLSYRVLFYYTADRTAADFWKRTGKRWTKTVDKFIGPGPGVGAAVNGIIAPGDTQDQKLRKIYKAVTAIENTDFTRQRSSAENKTDGLKKIANTDDVLQLKRGSGDQLTELFVAMARAAGMKAYLLAVADRSQRIFTSSYLSLRQLDDYLAIVNVDGKDQVFDPGQRYCTYGQLAWQHTFAGGMRQTDGGTDLTTMRGTSYKENRTTRIADLKLDERGEATGTVTLTYTGDAALHWRQQAAQGDDTSLNLSLKSSLEGMLPGGMDVRVTSVDSLTDPDKPLTVHYDVKGAVGSPTGKRLLVPAMLFETNSKPKFAQTKRELAVDMHYASNTQDAVRYQYPPAFKLESTPAPEVTKMNDEAAYSMSMESKPATVTFRRTLVVGQALFLVKEYPDLRTFYNKLNTKDQEPMVLTRSETATASAAVQ